MSQQLLDDWKQEDLGQSNTSLGGVRSTLTVASDTTADRQARDMELASSLGFSPEIVAEQRSWAEQEQTARTIEKNAQFAKWAAEDKTNAAFARDDTKSMYDVFEIMAGAERSAYSDRTGDAETRDFHLGMLRYKAQNGDKEAQKEMEFLEQNPDVGYEPKDYGWGTRLAIRGTEGTVNVAKSILGAIAMLGEAQNADYIGFAPLLKLAGKQARKYGEELDQGLQDWQKKIALPEVSGVQKYAEDFVQNLPQIAATIGAGVATGGLGWLSGVLGVGAMASAQIAGGQYLDLTKKPALNIPTAEELDRLATQRVLNNNIAAWQKKTSESGGADALRLKPTAEEVGLLPDGSLSPEYGVALNMARAEIIADEILNGPQSVPQDIARKAAFWNAAAQAPLEMIGLGKVFNIFKATGFGNVVKGVLESAATEFITETLQQYPDEFSQRWAEGKARGESGAQIWSGFYKDFWDITKEGMYSGLVAAPFGVLGGIGKVATDAAMTRQARDFVAGHLEFHQKIEETKAKKLAPSVLQSALEAGGLTQNVDIPAAEVLRLHQEGVPILDAMGWEEADVQLEADRGGEMTAKLSRLHSYLDGDAFNNIITFARPARGVWNMAEAEQFDARIKEDVDKVLAEQAQDDAERSAIDAERTRIEAEFRQAMQSIPGLRAEVKGTTSLTDIDVRNRDTIESAVAYNMSLIDSLAATFSKYEKASDFYSRISTRGMMFHPQNGRLVTPQEYAQAVEAIEQREEDLAREEAERPFWDLVWHRVDPESLKTDWPEAVKDFRARGLGQLFRPASKGGIAIDEIADELERRNLMPPGGGADALIEKLKEMSPPRRRRSRRLRYGQELAQEEKNSFGVPLSRVTRIEGNVTAKDVEIALEELAGQDLPNLIEGITAQVNSKQRGKLNSEKARNKSLDNGFTHAEHKGIAKNIAQAWKWAAEAQRGPDRKNNSPDLIMHKYVAALNVNGQDAFVWITARESPDGLRLYSVELMNEEKLRETVNAGDNDIATYVRNRSFEEILSRLNRPVNGQETTFFQSVPAASESVEQDDLQDEIKSIEDNDKDGDIRLKDGSYINWRREENWDDSEYILITGLEVAPDSRRKGLGRRLLRSALARIKSRFPDMEVRLDANPIGDEAVELEDLVEFYESEGFDMDEGEGMQGVPMTWDGRLRNRGDEGRLFHDNTAARQARGFVEIAKGHEYTIQLLQNANLSTLLHETGHIALSEMEHLMEMGLADDKLRADYQKVREYLGLKEGDNLSNLSDPRMVQANEKFAKAMELYLREGKAPSANLEGAFSRFKRWLMRIYKSVTDNPYFKGVTLNEDIRGVFDRLLANDAEIRRAAEKVGISDDLRAELDALGLKGNKRARITSLIQEAQEQAADNLQKARDAGRKAKLAEWRKEAQALIEDEPERKALKLMLKTGLDMDAVVQLVGEEMKTQLVKRQPGSVRKEGGVSPEKVAWEAGFASPEEMIAAVVSYPKYQDRIKEIVAAKQEEHDALFDPDDYLFETEELAAIEEQLAQNIADILGRPRYEAELSGETINGQPVIPSQEDYEDYGRDAQYRASREKLKAIAKDSLSRTKTSEALSPWRFRANVRRLVNEERRALLRKDWAAAQKANYELRLNMELARQSAEMLTRVTKFRTHLTRFLKEKRNDPDARYAVAALAVPVGLTKVTDMISRTSEGKNFDNVKKWVEAINGEGFPFTLNIQLFVDGSPVLWNDMPIAQFEEWYDTLEAMMTVEEEHRKVTTANGKLQLKILGEELAASIRAHNSKSDTRKVEEDARWVQWLKAAHAEHLKADTIAMLADGDKMGPVWQHIVRPISQATWDEATRLKAVKAKLDELFSAYSREELVAMRHNRVYVQAIGESVTREKALCALLNCGNESNLRRLMEGTGWTKKKVSAVLEVCQEKDWELAQAIWDYLETFREESFALEEKLTGVRPKAIEAQAIRSPSGKVYRGGYYPVRYNPRKASSSVAPEDMLKSVGNAFPVVEHGSMKERNAGRGLDAPLDLTLDVLTTHLTRTVHNLAFREPVITVGRILRQGDFKKAFMETAGAEQYKALAMWLQDVASTQDQDMGQLGRAMSWTRERMALYTMGLRVSTIVAQLTGGMASCVELGPRWMLQGMAKVFGHGRAGLIRAYQEAMAMSPMMQNRITSFDREVATATRKLMDFGSTNKVVDPVKRIDQWMREHAYIPMGYVQLAVDLPTWWGAYEKAMAENGGNPEAAAEYADHAVEITQVGGATKDLAGIQRHGEVMKIFTMYYSYFSCLYNISARKFTMTAREGVLPHAMQLAGLSMLWFVEPLISALLVNRGPDDDEAWYSWAAKEAAFNPFSMIVGVRDLANYWKNLLDGKNFGFRASPVFDLVETMGKAMAVPLEVTVGGKDLTKGRVKTVAKGIGMAAGSPLFGSQAITSLFAFWDVLDGSEELRLADLVFGHRK